MGLLDALSQIANAINQNSQPQQSHVDEIVREAPRDTVREGLREAFDANDTPSLGEQVGQMFGQSSNQQQAGLINQVIQALGPAAAAALAAKAVLYVDPRADRASLRDHVEQADAAAIAGVADHLDMGAARLLCLGQGG